MNLEVTGISNDLKHRAVGENAACPQVSTCETVGIPSTPKPSPNQVLLPSYALCTFPALASPLLPPCRESDRQSGHWHHHRAPRAVPWRGWHLEMSTGGISGAWIIEEAQLNTTACCLLLWGWVMQEGDIISEQQQQRADRSPAGLGRAPERSEVK